MSAHVVELVWHFSCLIGKVSVLSPPFSVVSPPGRSSELAGWLETEVTNRTVARLWPPGARGVLNEELMGPTSIHKTPPIVPPGYFKTSRTCGPRIYRKLKQVHWWKQNTWYYLNLFYHPHLHTPAHTSLPLTIWCWRWVRTEKSGGAQSIGAPWVELPGWWSLKIPLLNHLVGSCLSSACAFSVSRAMASSSSSQCILQWYSCLPLHTSPPSWHDRSSLWRTLA